MKNVHLAALALAGTIGLSGSGLRAEELDGVWQITANVPNWKFNLELGMKVPEGTGERANSGSVMLVYPDKGSESFLEMPLQGKSWNLKQGTTYKLKCATSRDKTFSYVFSLTDPNGRGPSFQFKVVTVAGGKPFVNVSRGVFLPKQGWTPPDPDKDPCVKVDVSTFTITIGLKDSRGQYVNEYPASSSASRRR